MHKNMRRSLLLSGLAAVVLLQGCATSIKASSGVNPAPSEAFSAFGRIEVKHAVFKEGVSGEAAALAKIDENLQQEVSASLAKWNRRPANGRTLVIEPVVEQLSFKHGAQRVLLGPLAGSSGVLMRMTVRDAKGKVVATPEFFQRAAAMSGGFAFGVLDNLMLTRVGKLAGAYIVDNFERPQGGPTGADDQAIAAK